MSHKQDTLEGKRVLHLTLKKKWFDMIASGKKKEEYRELKTYWLVRLKRGAKTSITQGDFILFDYIHFTDGYNRPRSINVKFEGTLIGEGKQEWGAEPGQQYFVIKLGDIIDKH